MAGSNALNGNGNGNGDGIDWTRAPQRPRAGTMPSTFHLAVTNSASKTSASSSSLKADPLAPSPDGLLSPALGLSARPSLLGRRLSGNPLSTASSSSSSNSMDSANALAPSSIGNRHSLSSATLLSLPSEGSVPSKPVAALTPFGNSASTSASTSSTNTPLSTLASVPTSTSGAAAAIAANGGVSPLELRASLLKSSQPISPDPVAAARLRSGSLTLPPSGLGHGFKPGVYGPPGSGTGTWTPRSTGMGTPLGMPASSVIIPEEHQSKEAISPLDDSDQHHPPPTAIGGILDFLDNDESTIPITAQHLPRSAGTNTPRHTSPTSARTGSTSSSLLSAGGRPTSGSISSPSSAHPSIQNLRQTYNDHSGSSIMQHSASATSAPDSAHMPLSPRSAARLRANTIAAPDPPVIRKSSPYYLSPSMAGSSGLNGGFSQSSADRLDSSATDGLSNHLVSLALNDHRDALHPQQYDGSYPPSAAHSYLYNPNRPRASTIGILDEANAMTHSRRRAGTTGPGMLPSGLRTPIYDGGQDGYLASGTVAEMDEEAYNTNGQGDPWGNADGGYMNDTYTAPVQFGESSGTPPPHQPTRSLWIGNIDARVTTQDLLECFAIYGPIESVRLLVDKDCAFVNFTSTQDALQARDDVLNRLNGQIQLRSTGLTTVRVGFGKATSAPPTPANRLQGAASSEMAALASSNSAAEPSIQTAPTRALWLGSIPSTVTSADLLKVFSPYGAIESARVLVHKQCGFINFENLDDAVAARKVLNGQEVLGPEIGPIKIGFAKVPSKMPETPAYDNSVNPAAAYQALKRLGGASAVPLEEQVAAGHLENFRSPMALQLAANGLNGIGPHSAAGLTQSLQPAVGLSPSVVASEFGGEGKSPQGVPLPSISEQQILMKELSGDSPDAEAHAQAIAKPRPPATYYSTIPPIGEDHAHIRARNLDTPRLRDIRKRLEAPTAQVSQAEVDGLANELLDDCVALSSDYIGNVIIQKLFERCSSTLRFAMLERIAPHLAAISCHKNGTWAAQKILCAFRLSCMECMKYQADHLSSISDTVSTPHEISLVCRSLQPYAPALLLDQFGNYAAQLSLRFFSPMSDFLFDAMIDRCWEIASGRFGARSARTCLEHSNVPRLQHKRVAISIILNSVNLATNPNGALMLTWLLDTSNLPGRYRLLSTRLAPHLAQLCPHKVASTTILKIVNQKVDPASSQMLVDAIFSDKDPSILEDILSEQVHGSSFMHKLLGSVYLSGSVRERGIQRVREILQKGTPHHSPAYAKLCHEVGLPPPPGANGLPHTPPPHKLGRGNQASVPYPLTMHGHMPHTASGVQHNGNPISPPFNFPSFGSPISPAPRTAPGGIAANASYMPRQASPFQPMFGRQEEMNGRMPGFREANGYMGGQSGPYGYGPNQPQSARPTYGKHGLIDPARSPNIMPSLSANSQQGNYTDQYLQNVAALQMAGFAGYDQYQHLGMPHLSPLNGSAARFNPSTPNQNGQTRSSSNQPY